MRFLGLAKICMNKIQSAAVISNPKHMSEGTYDIGWTFGLFFEMCTTEIHRSQGSGVFCKLDLVHLERKI